MSLWKQICSPPSHTTNWERFLQHIIQIYKRLRETKEALYIEREKLITHLQTSHEGLGVFNKDKKEILVNNLFTQYSNLISDSTYKQQRKYSLSVSSRKSRISSTRLPSVRARKKSVCLSASIRMDVCLLWNVLYSKT